MRIKVVFGILLLMGLAAGVRAQGTWTTRAPMPTTRDGFASAVANGIFYTIGGIDNSPNTLSVVEAYDPSTNTWSTKAPFPFPINRAAAGEVNGIIYVVGGCADNGCGTLLNTVFAYDPATNTWTQKPSIPTPRRDFGVAVVNGTLYALGGNQGPGYVCLASVEAYDPVTNVWSERSPLPVGRIIPAAAVVSGIVYAVGGDCPTIPSSELDAYNPTSDTWVVNAPLLAAQNQSGAGTLNGILYVLGGNNPPTINQAYDPATNTWTMAAPMPTGRYGPAVGVINDILFAIGGVGNSGILTTNEAFTPFVAQVQPPINADGSSVFSAKRGVVPVKFTLTQDGSPTCSLPPATISLARTAGAAPGPIDESTFAQSADTGSNFRIDTANCQYVYNLASGSLGPGTYLVQINIGGSAVGSGTFGLQ